MKKIIIMAVAVMILLAGYALLTHKKSGPREDVTKVAANQEILRYVAAEGKVEAEPGYEVEVGSELEGKIAELLVNEGDRVKKGDLIARIENGEIQAKLNEAMAELSVSQSRFREVASGSREEEIRRAVAAFERAIADRDLAARELERYKQLMIRGIVSKSELDEKDRMFRVASARVKESEEEKALVEKGPKQETLKFHEDSVARAEAAAAYYKTILDKTYILAPISGKVIRKYLNQGEMTSKEVQPYIVTVADVERARINAEVDETDIGKVKVGMPAEITTYAFPGVIFRGKVSEISDYAGARKVIPNNPAKNRDMKTVQVKIELQEKTQLKLGMTVDVRIKPGDDK